MNTKFNRVTIEFIPHSQQRYETVGDWYFDEEGNLKISVSKMTEPKYQWLVAIHELVEVLACVDAGISQKSVDDFDMKYESERKEGDDSEPGDDPNAPYVKQHCLATGIERILAAELGVSWNRYADEIESL